LFLRKAAREIWKENRVYNLTRSPQPLLLKPRVKAPLTSSLRKPLLNRITLPSKKTIPRRKSGKKKFQKRLW